MLKVRWLIVVAAMFALVALLVAACGDAEAGTVQAKEVDRAPSGPADSVWNDVSAATFTATGAGKFEDQTLDATIKVARTGSDIYVLLVWPDSEASMVKGTWEYDGQSWSALAGNEDRVAMLWEITRIQNFATKGCGVVCHSEPNDPKEWGYATSSDTERGDLWHWKSYRTNPLGYADDTWVGPAPEGERSGRHGDEGSGFDKRNRNAEKTGPTHMQDPAQTPSLPGFLLVDQAIEIPAGQTFAAGTQIPGRMLRVGTGSRADLLAQGEWVNGSWTVMLTRPLTTGNEDDVQFQTGRSYQFGVAIFDDSGDEHSYNSDPLLLKL